jgi:uncharacterized membrane protein
MAGSAQLTMHAVVVYLQQKALELFHTHPALMIIICLLWAPYIVLGPVVTVFLLAREVRVRLAGQGESLRSNGDASLSNTGETSRETILLHPMLQQTPPAG